MHDFRNIGDDFGGFSFRCVDAAELEGVFAAIMCNAAGLEGFSLKFVFPLLG